MLILKSIGSGEYALCGSFLVTLLLALWMRLEAATNLTNITQLGLKICTVFDKQALRPAMRKSKRIPRTKTSRPEARLCRSPKVSCCRFSSKVYSYAGEASTPDEQTF